MSIAFIPLYSVAYSQSNVSIYSTQGHSAAGASSLLVMGELEAHQGVDLSLGVLPAQSRPLSPLSWWQALINLDIGFSLPPSWNAGIKEGRIPAYPCFISQRECRRKRSRNISIGTNAPNGRAFKDLKDHWSVLSFIYLFYLCIYIYIYLVCLFFFVFF